MRFDFNKAEALKVLEQITALKTPKNLTVTDFSKQAAFIEDQGSLVAGFCTRRAGKSYAIGLKLCNNALKFPGVSQIYIALTRESAKRIMIKDVLEVISDQHNLKIKVNKTTLTVVFPNGSEIYLIGMDTNKDEMSKALGQKFKCAVIDEAGSFRQNLFELVYSVIKPACADLRGQIMMIGTPSNITKGLFYDVVWAEKVRGWNVHKWTAFDNPFIRQQWEAEIAELKEANPRIVETPAFRQNYLGEYVIDSTKLVYKFSATRNFTPLVPDTRYNVLGVDLGFEDASAFSLLGFNQHQKKTYVVETYKKSHMILSEVASRIEYFIKKYEPYRIVVDGAAKQAVEELKQRYGLPLETAEKTGKADFIEIMNSDFIMGNILLSTAGEQPQTLDQRLSTEYENLIWDDRAKSKSEHPNCENHLCFVAGTNVLTPDGEIPIEKLNLGDLVITRKGPRAIQYAINRETEIIELLLSNGVKIRCTPDHPFWSNGQWIPAAKLSSTDMLYSWSHHKQLSESDLTGRSIEDIKTKDTSHDKVKTPSQNVVISTGTFGKKLMGQYRSVIISTIRTKIKTTTDWIISNVYLQKIITNSTKSKNLKIVKDQETLVCSIELDPLQVNGIDQKKVVNGIENMGRILLHLLTRLARIVLLNIKKPICVKTKSDVVQLNALPQEEGIPASIMNTGNAHGVNKISPLINIQSKGPAGLCVLSITGISERQKVFNITVADCHEYFVEGILVSNCDATLYAWRYIYSYLCEPKAPKQSQEEAVEKWMENQVTVKEQTQSLAWWETN